VRLIDDTGKQVGVVPLMKALDTARERGLDLIQVTEKVEPPVCKIMDLGKYLYQQKKKDRGASKAKGGEIKGIRLGFGISEHDLAVRAKQAAKFLEKGDIVRIEMRLFGRQKALGNFAMQKVRTFVTMLEKTVPLKVERDLKREPRGLTMIVSRDTSQKAETKK